VNKNQFKPMLLFFQLSQKDIKNPLYLPFAKGEDFYFPLS